MLAEIKVGDDPRARRWIVLRHPPERHSQWCNRFTPLPHKFTQTGLSYPLLRLRASDIVTINVAKASHRIFDRLGKRTFQIATLVREPHPSPRKWALPLLNRLQYVLGRTGTVGMYRVVVFMAGLFVSEVTRTGTERGRKAREQRKVAPGLQAEITSRGLTSFRGKH
jgi:hypothetical protein